MQQDQAQWCPHCNGEDVQGGPVTIDNGAAWQEVVCMECGTEWLDYYVISSTRIINKGATDAA